MKHNEQSLCYRKKIFDKYKKKGEITMKCLCMYRLQVQISWCKYYIYYNKYVMNSPVCVRFNDSPSVSVHRKSAHRCL